MSYTPPGHASMHHTPLGSDISFVKRQNSRGQQPPPAPQAFRYISSRGSSDGGSNGSHEEDKYVSFADARKSKGLVDVETDSQKEIGKLGPNFDGETLVRIGAENDEVLEDMYRKELQEYYEERNSMKRLQWKNSIRISLVFMTAAVATAVAITTIVLTVKQHNRAGESVKDMSFQEMTFDGFNESDEPLKTTLVFVDDETTINASSTTMNENQYKAQHVSCGKISSFFENGATTTTTTSNNEEKYDIRLLIDDACDKQNIKNNPETFIKCQMMCASRMCCFSQTPHDNCYTEENKSECDLYSSCRTLLSYSSSPMSIIDDNGGVDDGMTNESSNIDEICSEESILSNYGFGTCQRICATHACCFISGDCNCYNMAASSSWCDNFKGCRHLLDAEPHMR